ncbi:MAG: hypothetical protein QXD34_00110 [Candidatus Bathyarchaeia archaeon]|nr:hypothetical protein [Candidatus Bathyarchaeota archaeon]
MKGTPILLVFFIIFLAASLLIPTPMFPGNIFCSLIGNFATEHREWIGAVFNAAFYGVILWLVFVTVSRKFERENSF